MAVKVKYKTKLDITKDMLKNISNVNGKRIEVGCLTVITHGLQVYMSMGVI